MVRFWKLMCALHTTDFVQILFKFLHRVLYSLVERREYTICLFIRILSVNKAPGLVNSFPFLVFLTLWELLPSENDLCDVPLACGDGVVRARRFILSLLGSGLLNLSSSSLQSKLDSWGGSVLILMESSGYCSIFTLCAIVGGFLLFNLFPSEILSTCLISMLSEARTEDFLFVWAGDCSLLSSLPNWAGSDSLLLTGARDTLFKSFLSSINCIILSSCWILMKSSLFRLRQLPQWCQWAFSG